MTRMLFLAMLLAGMSSAQAVEMPRMFSDGMVLQRGQPIPVWGRATPGAKVAVTFDGKAASAVADAKGDWCVSLPAHAAGGPLRMRIDDGVAPIELRDVLVGDVNHLFDARALLWGLMQALDWKLAVLVDEAHNLVERTRRMYSADLRLGQVQAALQTAPAAVRGALQSLTIRDMTAPHFAPPHEQLVRLGARRSS